MTNSKKKPNSESGNEFPVRTRRLLVQVLAFGFPSGIGIRASSLRECDCFARHLREFHRLMEASARVHCPFCGQPSELVIDTSIASQRFTTDCEVCCRPFVVAAECEPGEILSVEVVGD